MDTSVRYILPHGFVKKLTEQKARTILTVYGFFSYVTLKKKEEEKKNDRNICSGTKGS